MHDSACLLSAESLRIVAFCWWLYGLRHDSLRLLNAKNLSGLLGGSWPLLHRHSGMDVVTHTEGGGGWTS